MVPASDEAQLSAAQESAQDHGIPEGGGRGQGGGFRVQEQGLERDPRDPLLETMAYLPAGLRVEGSGS